MTIATICMAVCGAVCGYFEAQEDADTIAAHKPINYFQNNAERLGLLSVSLCAILIVCLLTVPVGWWDVVRMVAAWPAAFTIVFRYRLNTLRGLHWNYISPSNWWDYAFIWACWYREGDTPSKETAEIYHRNLYPEVDFLNLYREAVHRGGTLAYVTEAAILLAALLT